MQWGSATVGRAGVWGGRPAHSKRAGQLVWATLHESRIHACVRARTCVRKQSHSSPRLGSRRSAVPCSVPHSCANEPLSLTSGPRLEESLPISTVLYGSWGALPSAILS